MRQELAALLSSVQLLREGNPGRKIAEIQGKLATVPWAGTLGGGRGHADFPPPGRLRSRTPPGGLGQGSWNQASCCWLCTPRPLRVPVGAPTWTPGCWGMSTVTRERTALNPALSLGRVMLPAPTQGPGPSHGRVPPAPNGWGGAAPGAADSLRPCPRMGAVFSFRTK